MFKKGKVSSKKVVKEEISKKIKGKKKAKRENNAVLYPTKAPSDFKPHFLEVSFKTEKDGLIGSSIKAIRYQGRYDPEAEDKKKTSLESYDRITLMALLGRINAIIYKANPAKLYPSKIKERNARKTIDDKEKLVYGGPYRLPGATAFKMLLRVNKKRDDDSIVIQLKHIQQGRKDEKSGVVKAVELDRKDPVFKMLNKGRHLLPIAFKNVLIPPKRSRGVKQQSDDE